MSCVCVLFLLFLRFFVIKASWFLLTAWHCWKEFHFRVLCFSNYTSKLYQWKSPLIWRVFYTPGNYFRKFVARFDWSRIISLKFRHKLRWLHWKLAWSPSNYGSLAINCGEIHKHDFDEGIVIFKFKLEHCSIEETLRENQNQTNHLNQWEKHQHHKTLMEPTRVRC